MPLEEMALDSAKDGVLCDEKLDGMDAGDMADISYSTASQGRHRSIDEYGDCLPSLSCPHEPRPSKIHMLQGQWRV